MIAELWGRTEPRNRIPKLLTGRTLRPTKFAFYLSSTIILLNQALAQTYESVRDSRYEWQCETQAGELLSGHTRFDKANQSCVNRALAEPGTVYIVRGGTYRVVADNESVASVAEPDPVPDPVVEPDPVAVPLDDSVVKFGPVSSITQYPGSIAALAQNNLRWEITFNLNRVPRQVGLVSRDESGRNEGGHLSVWVENQVITVRHQDIFSGAESVKLESTTMVEANREYKIVVSVSTEDGIGLFVDGVLEDLSSLAFGLAGNDLPLTVGGLCSRCDQGVGPNAEIDGTVYLEIHDEKMDLPPVGSAELSWSGPTERTDGTALSANELATFTVYVNNQPVIDLEGDVTGYEYVSSDPGEHCFKVTVTDTGGFTSNKSNTVCKVF